MLIRNNPEVLRYINELDEKAMQRSRLFTTINNIICNAAVFVDEETIRQAKEEYGDLFIKKLISDTLQVDPELIDNDLVKEITDRLMVLDEEYYDNYYVKALSNDLELYYMDTKLQTTRIDAGFVDYCKCPSVLGDIPAAPNLYYSPKEFNMLQLWIDDDLWMTLSPNEVYTMREPIDKAFGKVITCGIGIGYYAIMAAAKDNVESVTVVENNEGVIDLFRHFIMKKFPREVTGKISIVHADAYEYLYDLKDGKFNYCFIDLWQGVQDTDQYFKAIHATAHFKKMEYSLWIEDSFIVRFREEILAAMANTAAGIPLNGFIFPFVNNTILSSKSGVDMWLSHNHIRRHIYSCVRKIPKEHIETI